MKSLILAGGSGTRLWPISRKNYPKQFLKLNGEKSLLRETVDRLLRVVPLDDIIVITNKEYRFYIQSDIGEIRHVILEPESKNTAPAIALGMKYCLEKLGCDEDEVIFVSPSDHIIRPVDQFEKYFKLAEEIARKNHLVTFGIKPTRPETGYGYIKTSNQINLTYLPVERFVEKPNSEKAKFYLNEDTYYWNSGMFAFCIRVMMEEFEKHALPIRKMLEMSFDGMVREFSQLPEISLDYAVMEKSNRVVLLPLDLYWNDVGSWDSLHDILSCDEDGNAVVGDVMTVDTKNCLIFGGKRLLSTIGLEDCLVVETGDAVLIAKKGEASKVREIVQKLKESHRKEAEEHTTTYRPWGSYTVLEQGPRYKIKRVVVNPGAKLSLQTHAHRSEHWVVVRGTAKVLIGDREVFIHENESAYVPKSTLHRLENGGKIPLEIIEIQNGEYLEEDDIERFDDDYGR